MVGRRSPHPIDRLRDAPSFPAAIRLYEMACRYERDGLWARPPAPSDHPEWWDEAIARARMAERIHGDALRAAAERMRAEGLAEFADALESGDYHACLAF